MSEIQQTVRSVLIPISDAYVLIPSAMVAEVLRVQEIEIQASPVESLEGQLRWRGQTVPLLSVETIAGLPAVSDGTDPRIVVLYGLQEALPFLAINSSSAPKILSITADMLQQPETIEDLPGLVAKLSLDEQTVYLPDVDYLQESALAA